MSVYLYTFHCLFFAHITMFLQYSSPTVTFFCNDFPKFQTQIGHEQ